MKPLILSTYWISRKLKALFRSSGYDIIRYLPTNLGSNPYLDMCTFLENSSILNIIDAGSNLGESTSSFLDFFPDAQYYCFEPCKKSYIQLEKKFSSNHNITVLNTGLSKDNEIIDFNENEFNFLSSYLPLGTYGYGDIVSTCRSSVISLDSFALQSKLSQIHILKVDVCGFELNVLKGCSSLLVNNRIKLIHIQLSFTEIFKPSPSFMQILSLLLNHNFVLIGIYRPHYQNNQLSWTDALLLNKSFK